MVTRTFNLPNAKFIFFLWTASAPCNVVGTLKRMPAEIVRWRYCDCLHRIFVHRVNKCYDFLSPPATQSSNFGVLTMTTIDYDYSFLFFLESFLIMFASSVLFFRLFTIIPSVIFFLHSIQTKLYFPLGQKILSQSRQYFFIVMFVSPLLFVFWCLHLIFYDLLLSKVLNKSLSSTH